MYERDHSTVLEMPKTAIQLPLPRYRAEKVLGFGAQGKVYAASLNQESSTLPCSLIASTSVKDIQHGKGKVALKLYNIEENARAEEEFKVLSCV